MYQKEQLHVANYAACTSVISLPIYNQIDIYFLYRNNKTNFIYILTLYTAHMKCGRENAVIHRAYIATSRTGHDNILK